MCCLCVSSVVVILLVVAVNDRLCEIFGLLVTLLVVEGKVGAWQVIYVVVQWTALRVVKGSLCVSVVAMIVR